MNGCRHRNLETLPGEKKRVRCRRCNLVISAEELGGGYCPECYETSGLRHYEFENISNDGETLIRYRCEECGEVLEYKK